MRLPCVIGLVGCCVLLGCEGAVGDYSSLGRSVSGNEDDAGTQPIGAVGTGGHSSPADSGMAAPDGGATPTTGGADAGGGTGSGNGVGSFSVTLTQAAPSLKLNDSKSFGVALTSTGGFAGMVSLAVLGLPAGVNASFDQSSVNLLGTASASLTLTSLGDALPGVVNLELVATSGGLVSKVPIMLTLEPELLVTIAPGVNIGSASNPNNAAFGAESIPTVFVAPGTKVTFVNKDGINHRIHASGTLGLDHQPSNLLPNAGNSYTQTLTGTGTVEFNCHIHPGMRGRIVVK